MANPITDPNVISVPFDHAAPVVPDDSKNLKAGPGYARGLYIGGAGNLVVDMAGGEDSVIFVGLQAGTFLPIRVQKVFATGTSATDILQLW